MPTIQELRAKRPELAQLSDESVVNAVHLDYPNIARDKIAADLGVVLAAPPPPSATLGDRAKDAGISLLKGAIGVPEAVVGGLDLVTGGNAGKAAEAIGFRPKEAKAMLDEMSSPAQKEANRQVQEADGFVDTTIAALRNPSVIAQGAIESLPSMGAGGVFARAALAAVPRIGAVVAGALGEGAVGAGSNAEQIRQETADGLLTPQQAGLAAASGVATTGLGLLGGSIAKKLGIADVDTMLAGAKVNATAARGLTRRIVEGAISEGLLEELPQSVSDQVLQNQALGRPLWQDVDQAAVLGALTGAAMGGGANVLSKAAAAPAGPPPSPSPIAPLSLSAPPSVVNVDGSGNAAMGFQQPGQPGPTPAPGPRETGAAIGQPYSDITDVQSRPIAAQQGVQDAPQNLADPIAPANAGAVDSAAQAATPFAGEPAALAGDAGVGVDRQPVSVDDAGPSTGAASATPDGPGARTDGVSSTSAPGEFASLTDAEAYAAGQRKNGSTIPAVAVTREDGTFGVAAKGTPEYELGQSQRAARELKEANAKAGVQDGDVVALTGKPFAAKGIATTQLKKHPGTAVVALPDGKGFVLRKASDAAAPAPAPAAEAPRAETPAAVGSDAATTGGLSRAGNTGVEANGLKQLDGEWHAFPDGHGAKVQLPRAEMPQIKAEHRGALTQFLKARGIKHEQVDVDPTTLKPSQTEFSVEKVKKALGFSGEDRAILISNDDHVLDGHRQMVAKLSAGEKVRAIRLDAPIAELIPLAREFPSAGTAEGASTGANPAAGKWFGTTEKAQAKLQSLGLTETHEVKETEPRKFELVAKTTETNTPQPEAAAKAETGKPENPGAGNAETGAAPTWDTMKKGDTVTFYRGEGEQNDKGGQWWTTDKAKAARYGKVQSVDLLAEIAQANAARGHNGTDEFVFADKTPVELAAAPQRASDEKIADARWTMADPVQRAAYLKAAGLLNTGVSVEWDSMVASRRAKLAPVIAGMEMAPPGQKTQMELKRERQAAEAAAANPGFSDAEKALQAKAHAVEQPGDVGLVVGGGKVQYVSMADAVEAARATVAAGTKPVPFQIHDKTGILLGDADRVIAAMNAPVKAAPSANTIFTDDAAEKARAFLKKRLGTLNSGIDPELLQAGITLAGYHIEKGARKFTAFAQAMLADLGESIRPYLKQFYVAVKMDPRATGLTGMDKAGFVEDFDIDTITTTPETENGPAARDLEGASAPALAGEPAGNVRPAEEGGNAAAVADGSGRLDSQGDARPGVGGPDAGRGVVGSEGAVPVPAAGAESGRGDGAGRGVPAGEGREQRARQLADARRARAAAVGEGTGGNPAPNAPTEKAPQFVVTDFTIEPDFGLGEGGEKAKFRANVEAIELLQRLQATQAQATPDEQKVLARYVGWGGLANAFEGGNDSWGKEQAELKALMSADDYAAAARSTRYAHYTSREVIQDGIYAALTRFGFTGGKVLEGGAGVGNFLGLMPEGMRTAGRVTAVEREPIAAGIAAQLYPKQNVVREDFTRFAGSDDYFDAAVGNPPFASDAQTDQSGRKHLNGLSLHNYFFAKEVDMLREGGILAQVVTNSFLDSKGDKARTYISDRTKFLGAIRLPNNAFSKNAGTEVTTDLIFLQKRPETEWSTRATRVEARSWLGLGEHTDKNGRRVPLNQYFLDHPEMMLGDFGAFGTMYREGSTALVARAGQDTAALLKEAVARLPADVFTSAAVTGTDNQVSAAILALKNPPVREGGFFEEDGKLIRRETDLGGEARGAVITAETPWSAKTKLGENGLARIKALAGLRATVRGLIAAEMSNDDKGMGALRAQLNKQYDAYVKDHGRINDRAARSVFEDDPDYPLLASLEQGYTPPIGPVAAKAAGIKPVPSSAKKSPIFDRRVVAERKTVTKVETPADALAVSMAERGRLDSAYIGQMLGKTSDQVLHELSTGDKPLLFKDPETGEYVLRDAYLSGNVRQKLQTAKQAGAYGNVRALEDVQPDDIGSHEIVARVGSPWVPESVYEDFVKELLGPETKARVRYTKANSSYGVYITPGNAVANVNTWGTAQYSATDLIASLLNNRPIRVTYKDEQKRTVVDKDATDLANTKAQDIRNRFGDWLFKDAERSELLTRAYNDTNNNYVTRQYDGSWMTFPGKVPDDNIRFRRHQRNAIARIVQDRTALLDHEVGAGKTFTVISGMMELKRTGLANKPMVAVPNHLVKQWAADWYRLYPGANILTATKKDFEKNNRRRFLAKIATGDWDAVIIAHSSFGFIRPSPEFETTFNQKQIALVVEAIDSMDDSGLDGATKKRTVKQLEGLKERLENRIKSLREKPMDALLDFKELGVDQLAVDEAHMFKNLMFSTKMQNVRGLGDSAGSQRAYDMYVKINQIYAQNGRGQGVVFATGTPVSNSLAEMYHMMRYLMPAQVEELGFQSFDAWANTFASVEQVWMQSPSGAGYKAENRLSNFVNTPELLHMFDQVSDTVTMADIKQAFSEENGGKAFPIPPLQGGRRQPVSIPKSPAQTAYMEELAKRAEVLEKRKGPPGKGEDNILVIMSDGRKAAMDIRLVNLDAVERERGGRIDRAADEGFARYKKFAKVKGTQVYFSDLGTPLKHAKAELKEYEALQVRVDAATEDVRASATFGNEAAQDKVDDADAAMAELEAKGPDWLDAVKAALRGFSVYDDLKAALIERGVPEHEIAFIHDFNTDEQKATAFRKMNSGDLRFMLGSTQKMGAGTNVQERLVAEHHLDVPWRPSDVEQREGRIIRQGNSLLGLIPDFHVEILAYVTQDTLDMRMWQVQETKLKMINQLRTRQVSREVDNAFEDMELSAGEMQAAATGNQDLLKEIQAKANIKKLEQRKRAYDAQRTDLETRRKNNAQLLEALPKKIAESATSAKATAAYHDALAARHEGFKVTIDGKEYTSTKEAGDYLQEKTDARLPSEKKGEPGKAAPINVVMDGEQYTSRGALADAFRERIGDREPILWTYGGKTFNNRRSLTAEIRGVVAKALSDEMLVPIGNIGGYEVTVEGGTDKFENRMLDVVMTAPDGSTMSRDVQVSGNGLLTNLDIAAGADKAVAAAERALNSASDEHTYLRETLARAKKSKADLDAAETLGEWPDQAALETARAAHAEVLKRLADSAKNKTEKPAMRQDDEAPAAGSDDHTKAIAKVVADIVDGWAMAPGVKVVPDINDKAVPKEVRDEGTARVAAGGGAPQAVIHQGRVYLFANQLPTEKAAATALFHEVLGHYGLRETYGDDLEAVLKRVATLRAADVQKVLTRIGLQDSAANRLHAAEEVLAYMAEKTPELGFVQKALAAIRTWLRERAPFFGGLQLSDAELIRDYLMPARRYVESGGPRGPGGGVDFTSFSDVADDISFSQAAGPTTLGEPREVFRKAMAAANSRLSAPGTLGWWHKTFGTQYNLAERSPAFKKVFDRVQDFIADISSYATKSANLAPTLLPQLDSWKDIVKKSAITAADSKAISGPIFQGTVAWTRDETGKPVELREDQPVQDAGIVWTAAELRDQWKLTPAQIGLYQEFRAATDQSLKDLAIATMLNLSGKDGQPVRAAVLASNSLEQATSMLSEHLKSLGDEVKGRSDFYADLATRIENTAQHAEDMMAKGYAPLSRFGSYTVDAVDENGERLYFSLFESKGEANRMAAKLKADFPTADIQQGTVSQNEYKVFAGVAPETAELFGEMLGLDAQADGPAAAAFQEWIKLAKSNRSAMKRLLTRKGISGYSEDASRVLAGFIYSNARQSSRNLHAGDIDRAVLDIRSSDKNAGELADAAQALAEYVKTPQEEGQAVRGLLFAQYIGGSLASAMVNLTQPITMTMPYLSQFGGIQKSAVTMKNAVRDAWKKDTGDKELDAAMKRAEDDGTVAPHETHQLQALAAGRAKLVGSDGTKAGDARALAANATSRLTQAWGKFFSMSELANRRVTFIAAYRTAIDQKMENPEAFARKVIQATQGVYNKGNKPTWARGAIGGTLFTFKQFSISYIEMMDRMYRSGPEGKKAALFALAIIFLMGGASGIPFVEDAEDVADALAQRLGYNFSAKVARQRLLNDVFGQAIGDFLDRGISGIPGVPIDVSGRLGMGNLIPGTGLLLKKDDHTRDVLELAGPAGDLFSRGFQSASALADGDAGKAALLLSPKAAQNVEKAIDMYSTGMYRDQKGRKVIDVDGWEALAKGLGFQPASVAQVQEATFTQQRLIAQARLVESEIAERWANAAFEKDADAIASVKQELKDWNARNPDSPIAIKPTQIQRRLKEMRKSKTERIAATAPKELRAGVKAALAQDK